MRKQERAAIEAVAGHFSATWEASEDASQVILSVARKRIAVEVATVKPRTTDRIHLKPRLRFDKVAHRLVACLQAALREAVPDGTIVIVTITAPIRLPAKTAEALEDAIRACLAHRAAQAPRKHIIHGNQIRICVATGSFGQSSKVIGFVHNPGSDPDVFLHMTQSLLRHIGAAADKRPPAEFTGDRWLVVADSDELSDIETYRHVYARLSVSTDFKKILMVLTGGRVESLTG